MSDEIIVLRRNVAALAEADKLKNARIEALEVIVKGLQSTAATQAQTIQTLQQQLAVTRSERGRGRTG